MKLSHKLTAAAIAITMGAGLLSTPVAARASEEGRRNTAIGLGAAALALLLTQHNKLPGIAVGVGAAYAATRIGSRHRWDRDRYIDNRYDRYDRDRDYRDRDDRDRYNRDNYRNDSHDRNDNRYNQDNRWDSHDRGRAHDNHW